MEGLDRLCAQNGTWRSQIDQIVRVDGERAKLQFGTAIAKTLRVDICNSRIRPWPHARTGRKDLESVGSEAVGDLKSTGEVSRDRRMNTDADAAVFPKRDFGRRRRFGTIFVGIVKKD